MVYKDLGSESDLSQASAVLSREQIDPYLLDQNPEFGPCTFHQMQEQTAELVAFFPEGPDVVPFTDHRDFQSIQSFICCFVDTRYLTYCYSIGWLDDINSTIEMMCELYINSYGLNLQKHGFSLFIAPFSNHLKHVAIRICSSALQIKRLCMCWIQAPALALHNLAARTHFSICFELLWLFTGNSPIPSI